MPVACSQALPPTSQAQGVEPPKLLILCDELLGQASRWAAGSKGTSGSPAEVSTILTLHQGDNVGKTCQSAGDTAVFKSTYTNAAFGGQTGIPHDLFSGNAGTRNDMGLSACFLTFETAQRRFEWVSNHSFVLLLRISGDISGG